MRWGGGGVAQPTGPYVYTFNHVTKKSPNFCRKDEENPITTPNFFVRWGGTTTPPLPYYSLFIVRELFKFPFFNATFLGMII